MDASRFQHQPQGLQLLSAIQQDEKRAHVLQQHEAVSLTQLLWRLHSGSI